VIATGMQTQLGKIADLLQEERPKTPLQERMKRFGKIISYLVLLICLLIFGFGILRGEEPIPLLLLSVSLAVAAIPEALPALITIALSLGAARLAKKEALIRKLPAVESLGSITYICTDKTGTLTKNQMTVMQTASAEIAPITSNYSNIDLAMALNHDIKPDEDGDLQGEATELALVNWVRGNLGEEDYQFIQKLFPRFDEVPFDSERKRMSTLHESNGKIILLCKGAMESILDACTPNADKDEFLSKSNEWAANGQRVLAFAGKILDQKPEKISADSLEKDLDFFGICGMIDPPREEAVLAIQECKTAGIHPVMITGDHPETAKAIAKEVGILESGQKILTGKEFAQLSDEQFEQEVEHISVYARVTPDQKIRIVKALQKRGHYVAMTGDGVNDAPSLRSSTIGVAMGITGTDVSKEAAHMIL
ncbi:MAG TPA: ATPase, partial [Algoriphagus sp.]|nr:ATPase [Algoriphagus sp.]